MQVKVFLRKSLLSLIGLLLLTISCVSTRKSGNGSQPEWEDLFVGASTDKLRGYKMTDFPSDSWVVENNTLRALTKVNNIDFITKDTFKNFELVFEWKTSKAGNSGVFLTCRKIRL